jgi:hypothetical protein
MHVLKGNYKSDQVHVPALPSGWGSDRPGKSLVTVDQIVLDPLLPWPVVWAAVRSWCWPWRSPLAGASGLVAARLRGRGAAAALLNPSLQEEEREPLTDIVVAVVDESASQRVSDRGAQAEVALAHLEAEVAGRENTELRVVRVGDAEGDGGSLVMGALAEALAQEPQGRLAGSVLITDGRVHDLPAAPALPAPLHTLLTGREGDWDRRLVVKNAPAFGILDEEITLTVRVEDQGEAPGDEIVPLSIAVDGGPPMQFEVPWARTWTCRSCCPMRA